MKFILFNIVCFFLANFASSQIWNYPPRPFVYGGSDSLIANNNISKVISWKHEVIDGIEIGTKSLIKVKSYDSNGNIIEEITGMGDTVLYDLYNRGYWGLKIVGDKSYHQNIQFDSSGNVIQLTVNDYSISVEYDSLNRPLIARNTTGMQIWEYQGSNLVKYLLYEDSIRIEERTYFYNTSLNLVGYTCEYYSREGNKYPNRDSVVAQMSLEQKPLRVISYEYSKDGVDSTEIIFNREARTTIIKGEFGCTKQTYDVNSQGLTISFYHSDCSGKLLRKESYEYVVNN